MSIDIKHEGLIVTTLSDCTDSLSLFSEYISKKESKYFIQGFFISFRQILYYFSKSTSPLIQYRNKFSKNEQILIDKIVDMRHASAHPGSPIHWLNEFIRISGVSNYKDDDVEIQYGNTKLFLLKEIIAIYKKTRKVLMQTQELQRLSKHPMQEIEKQKILKSEKILKEKLRDPETLLKI